MKKYINKKTENFSKFSVFLLFVLEYFTNITIILNLHVFLSKFIAIIIQNYYNKVYNFKN